LFLNKLLYFYYVFFNVVAYNMVTKRKTSGKTAKKGATGKRTKSRNAAECAVADDFYKTMRGCKNGTRKGSYGKLNYKSIKME